MEQEHREIYRNEPISFSFEGYRYRVDKEAYATDLIQMPDGRIIEVHDWDPGFPPKPRKFSVRVDLTTHPNAIRAEVVGKEESE